MGGGHPREPGQHRRRRPVHHRSGRVRGADGTRWVHPGDNFTGDPPSNRRTYLYYPIAGTDHPGGIQASGSFLVIASEGLSGQPPFVDIYQRTPDDVTLSLLQRFTLLGDLGEPVAPTRAITAAALTRLSDGRFLLFVLGKDEDQQLVLRERSARAHGGDRCGIPRHVAVPCSTRTSRW